MLKAINSKFTEWVVVVLLFGGVFYSATTAWKNEGKLDAVGEDVKSIKRSVISLLLDEKPNKSSIAKDLVSDINLLKGIESYKSGNYEKAYASWKDSALKGNRDSVYAIAVANEQLKIRANKAEISEEEKNRIIQALKSAPKIKEKDGIYVFVNSNKSE